MGSTQNRMRHSHLNAGVFGFTAVALAEPHGTTVDVSSLSSVAPGEGAEVITVPHRRKRVIQVATLI